ncbi:MAG: MiaB/RimO family radical SAM methylthiotransferase [Candidatus Gracilibacteria bacterium]|nr:MiaB/RimO family radical SAM methylthiotransferase [Candidatus Gracilibacteria bacterium]MDD2908365.1 MiaB/RimO family radical SAM methylthiotransferase [Candidatus Gracilibacteria bacterium]
MKFHFSSVNLGCNKNLVDLEFIIGEVLKYSQDYDIQYVENPEDNETEFVFINTCGFLSTSREEAENTIKYYNDIGKKIILIGCYVQVADKIFLNSLNNLYKIIPFLDYNSVNEILGINTKTSINTDSLKNIGLAAKLGEKKLEAYLDEIKSSQISKKAFIWKGDEVRAYINAPYGYEYLKIAEGCDNNCTFCIIPKIRGKQKSRPIEDIITEAKVMISSGIREIILIAQDTTRYGVDIYGQPKLIELLEELEKLDGDFKFRLLYMYPDNISLSHLAKLKSYKKFIPYFDIPFQHISKNVLKNMGRYYDTESIFNFLDYIKSNFQTYFLRTAFIIGFPGESDDDFRELLDFVKKYKFDGVALFEYHDEPLATSSKLPNKIESKLALSRIKELDELINQIYDEKIRNDKGKIFEGIIEGINGKNILVRRESRAPEIDELDIVNKKQIITKGELEIGGSVEFKI